MDSGERDSQRSGCAMYSRVGKERSKTKRLERYADGRECGEVNSGVLNVNEKETMIAIMSQTKAGGR